MTHATPRPARLLLAFLAALLATAAISASPAEAQPVTLGEVAPVAQASDPGNSCTYCKSFQQTTGANSPSYVVPAGDWVLTSWSTRTGGTATSVRMFLVEPAPNDEYALVAETAYEAALANQVNTFPARIPVEPGWLLGFDTGNPGTLGAYLTNDTADVVRPFNVSTTVGDPPVAPSAGGNQQRLLNLSVVLEPDADTDGYGDETQDNCVGVTNPTQADGDLDGMGDLCDNCPTDSNEAQTNTDGDAEGDACDGDDDNDGDLDGADNCQLIANASQANNDGDLQGNACDADDDNDGDNDGADNCVFHANPSQANNDGDAQGDACDADDDNDGVADASDGCPFQAGTQAGCPPDTVPPDTTITKRPKDVGTKRKVRFRFVSDDPAASFECKLDKKPWKPCISPKRYKVKPGKHKFKVRAVDPSGNVDPTPAKDKFKVLD